VLLMQIKVAKFGIDLSAADTMIRYSMTYSYEDVSQSEDRIVHPLKKSPLHYVDLVARNTVDEDLIEVIQDKKIDAKLFMSKLRSRLIDRLRRGKAA
jgi:SNF2 family DNA or RNA helicase